ncbi:MAG: hypothetical protein AABY53_06190 [Bdellovibrionota bacterium]
MSIEIQKENHVIQRTDSEICFRCPHCQKLYKTSPDVFDGSSTLTGAEFDCASCSKAFVLKNQQDTFGIFVTSETGHKAFSTCPKCSSLKPNKSDECPTCGVFATKYIESQKAASPVLFELNQQWQKVVINFDQDQYHQDFINKCHLKMALNFAFQKYADLQKSMGFDSLCEKYIRQIELRLEQQFKTQVATKPEDTVSVIGQLSLKQYFFVGIGTIGMLLLIYNKFVPTFPKYSGLVMILTIIAFGVGLLTKSYPNNKSGFRF